MGQRRGGASEIPEKSCIVTSQQYVHASYPMTRKRGAAAEANAAAAKHAAATAAITAAAANIASSRYIFYLAAGRVTRAEDAVRT